MKFSTTIWHHRTLSTWVQVTTGWIIEFNTIFIGIFSSIILSSALDIINNCFNIIHWMKRAEFSDTFFGVSFNEADWWLFWYNGLVPNMWQAFKINQLTNQSPIDLSHKSPVPYPTMHHFVTGMCMCAHICYKMVHCGILFWCIMEFVRWVYSIVHVYRHNE